MDSSRLFSPLSLALAAGISIFVSGCSMNADEELPPGKMALASEEREQPSRSLKELRTIVEELNPKIGVYPPKFESEEDKLHVYALWSDAFVDAKAFLQSAGNAESVLWTAAELARQGHNMDIDQTGMIASQTIEKCLTNFPRSVICHFSAADYYVSIRVTPQSVKQLRRSLDFLKKRLAPKVHQGVEEKYVQLYLYEGKTDAARKQLEKCLKMFPKSQNKEQLLALRAELTGSKKRN